jgi:hypothetical protein
LADDYSELSDYYVLFVAVCFNSFLFMTFANQNYITFSVLHTLPFRSRFNNSNNIIQINRKILVLTLWFYGTRHRLGSQIRLTLKVEAAVYFQLWTPTYLITPTLRYIPYSSV